MSQYYMDTVEADVGKIVGKCQLEWASPCYDMGGMSGRTSMTLKLSGDCELKDLRVKLPDGRTLVFPRLSLVKIQLEGLALPVPLHPGSIGEEFYHVEPPPEPLIVNPPPRPADDSDPF